MAVNEWTLFQTAWHVLPLSLTLLAGLTTTNDELIAGLVLFTGATFWLTAGVNRVTSTGSLTLTTTVRVVNWVHGDTANGWALALPTHPACFTPVDVGLFCVTHLADGCASANVNVADFTRWHPELGEMARLLQRVAHLPLLNEQSWLRHLALTQSHESPYQRGCCALVNCSQA